MTLAFLGARDEAAIEVIARAGLSAVGGLPAPVLRARGLAWLPSRGSRLVALDLDDFEGHARAVAAAVGGALAEAGLHEPEHRPFWAHLTLARVRERRANGPLPAPPAIPLAFESVALYRSRLSPAGARYEAIKSRRFHA